jgi:hypothetical protein
MKVIKTSGDFSLIDQKHIIPEELVKEYQGGERRWYWVDVVYNIGVYHSCKHTPKLGVPPITYRKKHCIICEKPLPSDLIEERDLLNSILRY